MTDVLIAIGHGLTPEGKYQPGAVNAKMVEHDWAARAVYWCRAALKRNGVTATYESDGGPGHSDDDPNFLGTVKTARAIGAKVIVEMHLNAGGGRGSEVVFTPNAPSSAKLGAFLLSGITARLKLGKHGDGLVIQKGHSLTDRLATDGRAAVITEGWFVDGDYAAVMKIGRDSACWRYGEGVAAGVVAYLGKQWVAPGARSQPPPPPASSGIYVVNKGNGKFETQTDTLDVFGDECARVVKRDGKVSGYRK